MASSPDEPASRYGMPGRRVFYDLVLAGGLLVGMLAASWMLLHMPVGVPLSALACYLGMASIILGTWQQPEQSLGWANRVTLFRGLLVCCLAGALSVPYFLGQHALLLAGAALLALALDGLDGWIARRTCSQSKYGARFDMEVDAFLTMVLCLALVAIGKVGVWIVLLGLLRYLFILGGYIAPWLQCPLPERFRRKLLCVLQILALIVCLLPWVSVGLAQGIAGVTLAASLWSFALDVRWLFDHRVQTAGGPERKRGN